MGGFLSANGSGRMQPVEDERQAARGARDAAARGPADGERRAPSWTRRRLLQAAGAAGLGLGGGTLLAACGAARPTGQGPSRLARIGFLSGNVAPGSPETEAFRPGLRALGYVEGRNAAIEWRFAERDDLLPQRAAELVG